MREHAYRYVRFHMLYLNKRFHNISLFRHQEQNQGHTIRGEEAFGIRLRGKKGFDISGFHMSVFFRF